MRDFIVIVRYVIRRCSPSMRTIRYSRATCWDYGHATVRMRLNCLRRCVSVPRGALRTWWVTAYVIRYATRVRAIGIHHARRARRTVLYGNTIAVRRRLRSHRFRPRRLLRAFLRRRHRVFPRRRLHRCRRLAGRRVHRRAVHRVHRSAVRRAFHRVVQRRRCRRAAHRGVHRKRRRLLRRVHRRAFRRVRRVWRRVRYSRRCNRRTERFCCWQGDRRRFRGGGFWWPRSWRAVSWRRSCSGADAAAKRRCTCT